MRLSNHCLRNANNEEERNKERTTHDKSQNKYRPPKTSHGKLSDDNKTKCVHTPDNFVVKLEFESVCATSNIYFSLALPILQ